MMESVTEKRQPGKEEIEDVVASLEEKHLVKWYGRWRNDPWTYAVVKTLEKIPFYLLIAAAVNWEKVKSLVTDPVNYLLQKGPFLLFGFILFVIVFRFAWQSNALKYYLLTRIHPQLQLHDDDRVGIFGVAAAGKLVARYQRWGNRRWFLSALLALMLPVTFFFILYLVQGLKDNQWSWQVLFANFEGGTDVAVFAIFFVFGGLLGNGLWRELTENFHLMQKAKSNREF